MVAKASKTVLMSIRVPAELKAKIDNLRAEYSRQGVKINVNETLINMLEKEVKKMEKEVLKSNPNFEHDQSELDLK